MDKDTIIGRANQDQELASIRYQWERTDPNSASVLLDKLEATLSDGAPFHVCELDPDWQEFVAQACAAGIRQAVLDGEEAKGDGGR